MSKSIKVHDETYAMLREMAEKHGRKITKEFDLIVLAKYGPVRKIISETLAQQFNREQAGTVSDEERIERR